MKITRAYTQTKRAEQQADTRRRIVEAAVRLHSTVGPTNTTTSMIAEEAGVQRHTVYAHFPDARAMGMACSGLVFERDPLPEAWGLQAEPDAHRRLTEALTGLYGWYARNAQVNAAVLRDAETDPLIAEIMELRTGQTMAGYGVLVGLQAPPARQAMWRLALGFHTWRTLTLEARLSQEQAVAAMVAAVLGAPT